MVREPYGWEVEQQERAMLRAALLVGGALALVVAAVLAVTACGGPQLRPEDHAHIAAHGLTLERCVQLGTGVGHEAGADAGLESYFACLDDAGVQHPEETR
jgi:hypothetical protein